MITCVSWTQFSNARIHVTRRSFSLKCVTFKFGMFFEAKMNNSCLMGRYIQKNEFKTIVLSFWYVLLVDAQCSYWPIVTEVRGFSLFGTPWTTRNYVYGAVIPKAHHIDQNIYTQKAFDERIHKKYTCVHPTPNHNEFHEFENWCVFPVNRLLICFSPNSSYVHKQLTYRHKVVDLSKHSLQCVHSFINGTQWHVFSDF